ncbi:MAG: prolyl oligopeptidase family serine peptidase [Robiginitomaculum sp.]|nr:prolyl oligopeptidase family serine peptidase [Robiginitomaculum sp.]
MRILSFFLLLMIFAVWPVASAAKPVSVEHYSRLPAVYDAAISPDGNWLATVVDNKGKYILRVFNLADRSDKKVRATSYPDAVEVNWVHWANNEQLLLSTRQAEKMRGLVYYTGHLFVIDRDITDSNIVLKPDVGGGNVGSRLGKSGGMRQFNNVVIDFLPNDPDHILMAYGEDDAFSVGVHKVNINTRAKKRIKRGSKDLQYWVTDRNGEVRLGQGRKDRSGDWRMTIRDAVGTSWRSHKEYPGLDGGVNVYGFTANPNELIIGAYNGKDTEGLYIYDLGQKKQTRKLFHHDKYDVDNIIISADGKKVVGASYLADTTKREYFDPDSKARLEKIQKALTGFQIDLIGETVIGEKILFKAQSVSNAPTLYLFDLDKNKGILLAQDYPEIGNTAQGDVTKVRYTTRDGYKIPGYVTTPPKIGNGEIAFKNQPFIIMPHGGPYGRDTANFDYLAQFMASRGYSVLQMNFRGSEGLGHAHEQAGRKNWEIMQQDVEDGTRWLIKKGYADPSRICIVGWSYGGYAALMGAITDPELYTCTASIAGVTDLNDLVNDMKKYRFGKHTAKHFLLKGFDGKADMKENSPVKRAREITIPVFMAHGTDDVNVHFDQFTRMKNALKKSSAKTTFMKFKDEDHYFIHFENRTKMMKGLDEFLRENLGASAAAP